MEIGLAVAERQKQGARRPEGNAEPGPMKRRW